MVYYIYEQYGDEEVFLGEASTLTAARKVAEGGSRTVRFWLRGLRL